MFKKVALFLPVLFFAPGLFGQKKYQVEFVVVAGLAHPIVDETPIPGLELNKKAKTVSPSFGLYFTNRFHKNWQAKVGVDASVMDWEMVGDFTKWGSEFDGNGGYSRDPNLDDKLKNKTYFWEINLGMRKNYGNSNFYPFLEMGIGLGGVAKYEMESSSPFIISPPKNDFQTNFQFSFRPAVGISRTVFGTQVLSLSVFAKTFLTDVKLKTTDWKYRFFVPGLDIGWAF